jgi:hypothetical protein
VNDIVKVVQFCRPLNIQARAARLILPLAVLGRLGQCGIMVRATLKLVPAPAHALDPPASVDDMFVLGSNAEQYITSVLGQVTFNDIPDLPNFIYGFRKSRLQRPMLRTSDEEIFFLFNVLRTTDPPQVPQAVAKNREFL